MSLHDAAKKIRDAFTYDPGHSDLDNEQPISIHCTLGDWRKLDFALNNAAPQANSDESVAGGGAPSSPAVAAPAEAPQPAEVRLNDDKTLDEVVTKDGDQLEQMDYNHWFLHIGDVAVWLHSKSKINATYERRAYVPSGK